MEMDQGRVSTRTVSDVSMLMAVITFLAMWGGVTLVLTDPHGPHLPPFAPSPRGILTSILLFWAPTVSGGIACLTGLAGLSVSAEHPDVRRRAAIGILIGLTPACLAAAWLGWVLLSTSGN